MSNMSYCRFTNTRDDLEDCLSSLEYEETVSESEAIAGKRCSAVFCRFAATQTSSSPTTTKWSSICFKIFRNKSKHHE